MIARRHRIHGRWTTGSDYRVICTCQKHAGRGSGPWRHAAKIASRGVAVFIGLPLAFMVLDFPTKAMNLDVSALRATAVRAVKTSDLLPTIPVRTLAVFDTPSVREQFLVEPRHTAFTADGIKEQYFSAHVPYGAIIYREARRNNLPPELVAAMVHTESDFRPRLVSHKSAQGLMQIVPGTARILNIENPFDPEQNIAAGTRYFRYLLDRFEDERLALAAYNAGEGNVERFGGIPPFPETQSYIEKVHFRASRYRQHVRTTYIASMRTHGTVN